MDDLATFEQRVARLVATHRQPVHGIVSRDLNTGRLHSSMLLKKLNEGDYDAVPAELMKWVYTGGKRVKGLINLDRPRLDWGAKRVRLNQHATGRTEGSQLVTKENVSWVAGVLSMTAFAFTGTGPHQWAGDLVVAFVVGAVLFIRNWLGPA